MKRLWILSIIIIFLMTAYNADTRLQTQLAESPYFMMRSQRNIADDAVLAAGGYQIGIIGDSPVIGNDNAPFTVIAYLDIQQGVLFQELDKLYQKYPDDVRIVYKHFIWPTSKTNTIPVHRAIEAARLQGKFLEMARMIYQAKSSERNATIYLCAEALGLDMAKFERDMWSDAVKNRITEDLKQNYNSVYSGHPVVLMNGFNFAANTITVPIEACYNDLIENSGNDSSKYANIFAENQSKDTCAWGYEENIDDDVFVTSDFDPPSDKLDFIIDSNQNAVDRILYHIDNDDITPPPGIIDDAALTDVDYGIDEKRFYINPSDSPYIGNPNAPVTIIAFVDLTSPFVRFALSSLDMLLSNNPDKLRIMYKHLPNPDNAASMSVSIALEAANEHNLFFEMLHAILNQDDWKAENLDREAASIGLTVDNKRKNQIRQKVLRDVSDIRKAGINNHPVLLINGKLYNGPLSAASLDVILKQESEFALSHSSKDATGNNIYKHISSLKGPKRSLEEAKMAAAYKVGWRYYMERMKLDKLNHQILEAELSKAEADRIDANPVLLYNVLTNELKLPYTNLWYSDSDMYIYSFLYIPENSKDFRHTLPTPDLYYSDYPPNQLTCRYNYPNSQTVKLNHFITDWNFKSIAHLKHKASDVRECFEIENRSGNIDIMLDLTSRWLNPIDLLIEVDHVSIIGNTTGSVALENCLRMV